MKTKLGMLLLITFIAISIIIVYKEASARPMLCDTVEQLCLYCRGNINLGYFDYIYCEERGGGLIYCEFDCYFPGPYPPESYPFPCPWEQAPVWGICVL